MRIIAFVAVFLLVGGCAGPQPMLAPSPKLQEAGPERSQGDVRECMAQADHSTPVSGAERAAQDAAAIPGRVSGGTNVPGGGVIPGPARPASPGPTASPVWKAAVERCLADRGYTVSGWK